NSKNRYLIGILPYVFLRTQSGLHLTRSAPPVLITTEKPNAGARADPSGCSLLACEYPGGVTAELQSTRPRVQLHSRSRLTVCRSSPSLTRTRVRRTNRGRHRTGAHQTGPGRRGELAISRREVRMHTARHPPPARRRAVQ